MDNTAWRNDKIKLPKLFEYDDFDECRQGNLHFEYCVVRAVVQPDADSYVWQNISTLLADSRNFPYDQLERGFCLRNCLGRIASISRIDVYKIETRPITDEERIQYLDRCVNIELKNRYDLRASSSVLHCMSESNFQQGPSIGEILFLCLAILLMLLVCVATVRDCRGIECVYDALIKPFSLPRNVNKLLDLGKTEGNLSHLEGLRAIHTVIVFVVHSSLPMMRMPLKNVEDLEAQTNSFIFPVINSLNTHMITFFFALGGMVLSVSFLNHIDRVKEFEFSFQWKKLLNRLARLLPAYVFIIFYQATLFKRTKQTPVAYKFYDYCSEHWWSNLLMINNFVHLDEPCLQYGWYLGADFQLFLIGMAIMTLIWRFPALKRTCIGVMILVSFVVPGFVIYKEKLDATMTFAMRHALNQLREYDVFLKYYTPFYTNAGTYFFGMIAGMLYHHVLKNKFHLIAESTSKRIFGYVAVLMVALNGFLAFLPSLHLEKPSLFLALFGSTLKAIWGIGHSTMFLLYAFKRNSMQVDFLKHPILAVLAKLSYAVYITQYSVIHMVYSNLSVPIRYDFFNTLLLTSAIFSITFFSAILLHVAVEVPCASILKQVIDGQFKIGRMARKSGKYS
ncbi:regulator of hypoxia-inducible factor 1-like [Ochlerotatus camptorhynchus]|uniref:regulator of hypoxia-inducible factor 1-like n=1 Tax=Ochlerotatus camptorhynchus TaxID=644619 RepID=UPI0031DC3070